MELQIWHDERAVKMGGVELSSIGFWLTSDTTVDLPQSFQLLVNARVCGVQIGTVTIKPLKNGPFTMPLLSAIGGAVQGRIDDWNALDSSRGLIDDKADPHWKTANEISFSVTGIADVTIPSATIVGLIPALDGSLHRPYTCLGTRSRYRSPTNELSRNLRMAFKRHRYPNHNLCDALLRPTFGVTLDALVYR